MVVSYSLSIVTITLSLTIQPQFAAKWLQRKDQQKVVHFQAKFGEGGLMDVSHILKQSVTDMGLSHAKEIVLISSAIWAQCMNVTDRETNKKSER